MTNDLKHIIYSFLLLVFLSNTVTGQIYVDIDATGTDDGTSWTNAYNDLQDAINSASTGDQIWVAEGTYYPTATTDPTISFVLKSDVDIYGGFDGTEMGLTQRNPSLHTTVLSGDIGTLGVDTDNSYTIIYGENVSNIIISGFTIEKGYADFADVFNYEYGSGAGFYLINHGYIQIDNCIIQDNHSPATDGTSPNLFGLGGGIMTSLGELAIFDCIIQNNSSSFFAGGLYSLSASASTFENIDFIGNTSLGAGAVYINSSNTQTFTNCTFRGNLASFRGGGVLNDNVDVEYVSCLFSGNDAGDLGGAARNSGSTSLFKNCTFSGNNSDVNGGAISNENATVTIENSILWGNSNELHETSSTIIADYNIIEGGYGSGTNIIDQDPLFIGGILFSAAPDIGGDFRLQGCSPAVNASNPITTGLPSLDLDDNERIRGGVDMGGYEVQGTLGIIYVNEAATGDELGTSWEDAYTDLQSALTSACDGEIWVAAGTYYPTSGADRSISFILKDNVAIYGGFNGTETTRNEREIYDNVTILSGDIGILSTYTDNSYHVVTADGVNSTAILDGFVIESGYADGGGTGQNSGGGLYLTNSSPTISYCIIQSNFANSLGGGMYLSTSSPTITNAKIKGNTSSSSSSSHGGGGIYMFDGNPTLANVSISGNLANGNGGGILANEANYTIVNCSFNGNNGVLNGGGLYHFSNPSSGAHIIKNSIFWGNSSEIHVLLGTITIDNSIVEGGFSGGTNIIDQDPLFFGDVLPSVAPDLGGDYRVQSCSPAINAGDPSTTGLPSFDLDEYPRIYNSIVDLGPYEVQGEPGIIYVDASATGDELGTSWTDAFTNLSAALESVCTGEIWVKAGVYTPLAQNLPFALKNNVAIYGGFDGSETARTQRDFVNNITILSGDINGDDNNNINYTEPTRLDNAYHVVVGEDVDNTAILDGFIVESGHANGASPENRGGGIYLSISSNLESNTAIIRNCIIQKNVGDDGGGSCIAGPNGGPVEPKFINTTFFNNFSNSSGGAVLHYAFNEVDYINCKFIGNTATGAGGAVYYGGDYDNYDFINCLFASNTSLDASLSCTIFAGPFTSSNFINCTIADPIGGSSIIGHQNTSNNFNNSIAWQGDIEAYFGGSFDVNNSIINNSSCISNSTCNANVYYNTDPQFTDPDGADNILGTLDDDYTLLNSSIAFNAGSITYVPNDIADLDNDNNFTERVPLDLANNKRDSDCGNPDIGAYELQLNPDSLELVAFYYATNGASWTNNNWDLSTPMNTWSGVTVTEGGCVQYLVLNNSGLTGPLIDLQLGSLDSINVRNNNLNGTIPNFTGLNSITSLNLRDNNFSGSIPNFSSMPFLEILNLRGNDLTGSIPDFAALTNLQILILHRNDLTGAIPDFNLPNLVELNITSNNLNTSIPDFTHLTNLQKLHLGFAKLSGGVPNFTNLTSLEDFRAANNTLSGTIPSFTNSPNLERISLHLNDFTAVSPQGPALEYCYIQNNNIIDISNAFPALIDGDASNNAVTFEDLLNRGFTVYSPQDSIGVTMTVILNSGDTYIINLNIDNAVGDNLYNWYKDNILIATTSTNQYTITNFNPGQAGDYRCEVTNPSLPALTLHSRVVTIESGFSCYESDSTALAALYHQTNGDQWTKKTKWLSNAPLDQWYGITTNTSGCVTEINLTNNNLSGIIPTEMNSLTELTSFKISQNSLMALAFLTPLANLTTLEVQHNQLTFGDIVKNITVPNFTYAPQDSIGTAQIITLPTDDTYILQTNVDAAVVDNSYTWYKDGNQVAASSSNALVLNNLQLADAGNYNVKITNPNAPSLQLYSRFTTIVMVDAGPDQSACVGDGQFALTGAMPTGGIWSGTGITDTINGIFDPNISGVGTFLIAYTQGGTTDYKQVTVNQLPTVEAGNNQTVCSNDAAFQLTGFAPQGGTWSGTGVDNAGLFNPNGLSPNTYTLTYTFTDANTNCQNSDTRTITIVNPPTVNAPNTLTICNSTTDFQLTGFTPNGGTWSGAGIVNSSQGLFNPTIAGGTGVYTITYSVIDANGCTASQNTSITVPSSIVVDAGNDESICIDNGILNLNGFTPTGGTWSGTGIDNAQQGTFDPQIAGVGTHTITYTYTDPNTNCITDDTKKITVNPLPTVFTTTDTLTYCDENLFKPIPTTAYAPQGGIWSGVGIDTNNNFNPSVAGNGLHTLTYTYTSPVTGCVNSSTLKVKVIVPPTVNAGIDTTICFDSGQLILSNTVHSPLGGKWTGSLAIVNENTGAFDPIIAGGGTHVITYSYQIGECINTDSRVITVDFLPINAGNNEIICNDADPLVLNGAPSGGVWTGQGITNPSGVFDPSTVPDNADYTLYYTITNPATNCAVVDSIIVSKVFNCTVDAGDDEITCLNVNPYQLTGFSPTNGSWSGTGITDTMGIFDPSIAGVGVHTLTYQVVINNQLQVGTKQIEVKPLPVVTTPDTVVCNSNQNLTLQATPIGGTWVDGDGIVNFNTGLYNTVLGGGVGQQQAVYKYTDLFGCVNRDTMQINVIFGDTVKVGLDESLCLNFGLDTLTNFSPLGGVWSGSGIVNTTGIFDPQEAGIGVHLVTYTVGEGTCRKSLSKNITVSDTIIINLTSSLEVVCETDSSFQLSNFVPYGGVWSGAGISDATNGIFNANLVNNAAGIYTLTYTVLPGSVCSVQKTKQVQVVNNPAFFFTQDTVRFCDDPQKNDTLSTYVSTQGGVWSGPAILNAQKGIFSNGSLSPGFYNYNYTYTDGNSCSTTKTLTIEIIDNTAEAGNDLTVCANDGLITLSGQSPQGGVWSGQGIIDPVNGIFDPSGISGQVTITYAVTNANCTLEDTRTITVNTPDNVTFDLTAATPICTNNGILKLNNIGQSVPSGGFWTGNGVTDSLNFNTKNNTGDYIITYTFTNQTTGCTNSDTALLTLNSVLPVNAGPNIIHCDVPNNIPITNFTPTIAGGTWSGLGVQDANLGLISTGAAGGTGFYEYIYAATNPNGCVSKDTVEVTIVPLPIIEAGTDKSLCITNGLDTLSGYIPSQGGSWTFSNNVLDTTTNLVVFSTNNAIKGNNKIYYTAGIGSCRQTDSMIITVDTLPIVNAGGDTILCQNPLAFGLKGTYSGSNIGSTIWNGTGITSPLTGIFDPDSASIGVNQITYTVTTVGGCQTIDTINITVKPLPAPPIPQADIIFCPNEPYQISFSNGSGNPNVTFQWQALNHTAVGLPAVVGTGDVMTMTPQNISGDTVVGIVTVNTELNGCTNTPAAIDAFNIFVKPTPIITPVSDTTFCPEIPLELPPFTSVPAMDSIQWNSSNPFILNGITSGFDSLPNITLPANFTNDALTTVSIFGDLHGCVADTVTFELTLYARPEKPILYAPNGTDYCTDGSVVLETKIGGNNYQWYRDGVVVPNQNSDSLNIWMSGVYWMTALNANCESDTSNAILIDELAGIPVSVDDNGNRIPFYYEQFENGDGGWFTEQMPATNPSDWAIGVPNGTVIDTAASGQQAWATRLNGGHTPEQQSWVISPCFDFSNSYQPVLALSYWSESNENINGVVIQYLKDDTGYWKTLGEEARLGINWYNSKNIIAKPGGKPQGWTGSTGGWKIARYALDEVNGSSAVRFRIAFASQNNPFAQDGFAFDDVWIGERVKEILIENFTSVNHPQHDSATTKTYNAINQINSFIPIQYHVNDAIANQNVIDNNARALYYNVFVNDPPHTVIDGNIYDSLTLPKGINQPLGWIDTAIYRHVIIPSPFYIDSVALDVTGNTLRVSSTIYLRALDSLPMSKASRQAIQQAIAADKIVVRTAIIEKVYLNGTDTLRNVMHKMLPSAAGVIFDTNKKVLGGSAYSYQATNIQNSNNLDAVVFLQHIDTKEVYAVRSGSTFILVSTQKPLILNDNEFTIYPNPARDMTNVKFDAPIVGEGNWKIFDTRGILLKTGNISRGIDQLSISTEELASGMYWLTIGDEVGFETKELIIVK